MKAHSEINNLSPLQTKLFLLPMATYNVILVFTNPLVPMYIMVALCI